MTVVAVLQARFSSTRLPGKVLEPLLGRPMLARQLERVGRAHRINQLIVATSVESDDDPIALLCNDLGISCYRGSLDDVLDRMYRAAENTSCETFMRLTGDCPLADPKVLDDLIEFFQKGRYDYASNTIEPSFPDGLDAEIMRLHCLETAWQEAKLPSEREHVTPFIYNNPGQFKLGSFRNTIDLSGLRWTVDEPSDFDFVTQVYQILYPKNPEFSTADILQLLDQRPKLAKINRGSKRNEGFVKSLHKDKEFLKRNQ